jgi:hypothetical protein
MKLKILKKIIFFFFKIKITISFAKKLIISIEEDLILQFLSLPN